MYECMVNHARPAIYDSIFDSNLANGTVDGKRVRRYAYVAKGEKVGWVDPASRELNFRGIDSESKAQDKRDIKKLKELLDNEGAPYPTDAKIYELAESVEKILADARPSPEHKAVSRRVFTKQSEPTNQELILQIKALGGSAQNSMSKLKLKELLAELEA